MTANIPENYWEEATDLFPSVYQRGSGGGPGAVNILLGKPSDAHDPNLGFDTPPSGESTATIDKEQEALAKLLFASQLSGATPMTDKDKGLAWLVANYNSDSLEVGVRSQLRNALAARTQNNPALQAIWSQLDNQKAGQLGLTTDAEGQTAFSVQGAEDFGKLLEKYYSTKTLNYMSEATKDITGFSDIDFEGTGAYESVDALSNKKSSILSSSSGTSSGSSSSSSSGTSSGSSSSSSSASSSGTSSSSSSGSSSGTSSSSSSGSSSEVSPRGLVQGFLNSVYNAGKVAETYTTYAQYTVSQQPTGKPWWYLAPAGVSRKLPWAVPVDLFPQFAGGGWTDFLISKVWKADEALYNASLPQAQAARAAAGLKALSATTGTLATELASSQTTLAQLLGESAGAFKKDQNPDNTVHSAIYASPNSAYKHDLQLVGAQAANMAASQDPDYMNQMKALGLWTKDEGMDGAGEPLFTQAESTLQGLGVVGESASEMAQTIKDDTKDYGGSSFWSSLVDNATEVVKVYSEMATNSKDAPLNMGQSNYGTWASLSGDDLKKEDATAVTIAENQENKWKAILNIAQAGSKYAQSLELSPALIAAAKQATVDAYSSSYMQDSSVEGSISGTGGLINAVGDEADSTVASGILTAGAKALQGIGVKTAEDAAAALVKQLKASSALYNQDSVNNAIGFLTGFASGGAMGLMGPGTMDSITNQARANARQKILVSYKKLVSGFDAPMLAAFKASAGSKLYNELVTAKPSSGHKNFTPGPGVDTVYVDGQVVNTQPMGYMALPTSSKGGSQHTSAMPKESPRSLAASHIKAATDATQQKRNWETQKKTAKS